MGTRGLGVLVFPTKSKLWIMEMPFAIHGK